MAGYTKKYLLIYLAQGTSMLLGMLSLFIVTPFITSNKEVYGVYAICVAQIISTIFNLFVNTYVTGRVCGLGLKKQTRDFLPYLILSVIVCLPALYISYLPLSSIVAISLGVTISIILYFCILYFRRDDSFFTFVSLTPLKNYFTPICHSNLQK